MTFTDKAAAPRANALLEIESAMLAAWTGAQGSPFLAEAPIGAELAARAEAVIRGFRHTGLFARFPTLATWGVLTPLARNYGADDRSTATSAPSAASRSRRSRRARR